MIEVFIPAISATGGAIIGFLLSVLKDRVQRKAVSREKFFYEIYPKRLRVYEDVLNYFYNVRNKERSTLNRPEFSTAEISDAIHALEALLTRISIYGSTAAREPLNTLLEKMFQIEKDVLRKGPRESRNISAIFYQASLDFTKLVRKETLANFVDKEVMKFVGNIRVDENGTEDFSNKETN